MAERDLRWGLVCLIFTDTCSRLSREIFTLAHEIGHAVLHMDADTPFIDDSVTLSGRSTNEKEQEANYFAACLLMPSDEVDRFLDLRVSEFAKNGLSAMDIAKIMSIDCVIYNYNHNAIPKETLERALAYYRLIHSGICSSAAYFRKI